MKRLRVVQLIPALNAGGVERCVLETSRALVSAGHESIVVSSGGRMVSQLKAEGGQHYDLPIHRKSPWTLLQVRPLRKLLESTRPDIIHIRSRIPGWVALLAIRGIPADHRPHVVSTMHGLHSVSRYSAIMTHGEAVIAGSLTVRDYILKNYPACPADRIHLIPEGVDTAEFPYGYQPTEQWLAEWQAAFPELSGKTILALPGRLTRLKGHATFIELIQSLKKSYPNIHGLIIGGAETGKQKYENELKQAINTAGLSDFISLTGHRSDIRDVMSQCDLVFSLSTKPESFGRTVLEAIRLGKPVIGWDIGGVGEILDSCYPAGRVPFGTSEENRKNLLETTERWLNQPNTPQDSNNYLLSDMTAATLALYKQLITSPKYSA